MAKFSGEIGFAITEEETINGLGTGVWVEHYVERHYYGDLVSNRKSLQSGEHLNDDINISNSVSIVADPFAHDHLFAIRYVKFRGTKWKATGVEVQYPRLILSIGGVYNAASQTTCST